MADVEVPDPKDAEEKASDPFTKTVALMVAVYAVALAITALGGSNAGKDMVMAQQKASNEWARYQSKVMRENMYLLAAEELELQIEEGSTPPVKERRQKKLDDYRANAARYAAEKKDIQRDAEGYEAERDTAARRDPYFDYAEVLLQIAIVLASVAMLSGRKEAFYLSAVLAALGAGLCVNGYGLVVKIPGLG